jgi:hypothetical protein
LPHRETNRRPDLIMDVSKVPPGRNPPDDINAVIAIPQGGGR